MRPGSISANTWYFQIRAAAGNLFYDWISKVYRRAGGFRAVLGAKGPDAETR
jgi:hypothetical protein